MIEKIDILLATYNGEKYLHQQLESLLAQTNDNWRLIVHDDGSTDETVAIIKDFVSAHPGKAVFVEDGFIAGSAKGNFLHLLHMSDAPYVMFCDQDDIWLPQKAQCMFDEMVRQEKLTPGEIILVHSDLQVVDAKLHALSDSFWKYQGIDGEKTALSSLAVQNVVTGCAMMVNRPLLSLVGGVPDGAIMHDWWLAMIASAFGRIVALREPLVRYRQHGANAVGAKRYDVQHITSGCRHLLSQSYLREYRRSLRMAQNQAADFLDMYSDRLSLSQKRILNDFSHLSDYGWLRRRIILIRHKLFRQGVARFVNMLWSA